MTIASQEKHITFANEVTACQSVQHCSLKTTPGKWVGLSGNRFTLYASGFMPLHASNEQMANGSLTSRAYPD